MGGLASDGTRWTHARPHFFLPIPLLRALFRGKLVAGLRAAHRDGRLDFPGTLAPLKPDAAFRTFVRSLYRQAWVVYAKPPFGSPSHVLHYLARYTHRVAISNHRLVDVTDDTVSFRWKDYRHGSHVRTLTLEAGEFLRRFLLHVLPRRFVRIRYFGFLASRCRTVQLPQCRRALTGTTAPPPASPPPEPPRSWPCPRCGAPMRVIERLTPRQIISRRSSPTSSMTRRSRRPWAAKRHRVAHVRAGAGGLAASRSLPRRTRSLARRAGRHRPTSHVEAVNHARARGVRTIERT